MSSRWINRTAHTLAILLSILVLTLVPIVLYGLFLLFQAIAFGGGAQIEILILVPLLALLVAVVLTVGLFMPVASLVNRVTQNRRNASGRASLLAFLIFLLLAVGLQIFISGGTLRLSPLALQFDALVALVLFASFLVYWLPLRICLSLFASFQKLAEKPTSKPTPTRLEVEPYQPEFGATFEQEKG